MVLAVTPKQPVDPDRYMGDVPADVAAALLAAGQAVQAGLWSGSSGPCRLLFKLSGADRVEVGHRLEGQLRKLGYAADLSISR